MNKDNAKDYLPLVQALAEGKTIQLNSGHGWEDVDYLAPFSYEAERYRVKPEPRKPSEQTRIRPAAAPAGWRPACVQQRSDDIEGNARIGSTERPMNPRAWLVSKADMHGNLYDALAWDNGGKPLGVSVNTPIPLYEAQPQNSALHEQLDAFREVCS